MFVPYKTSINSIDDLVNTYKFNTKSFTNRFNASKDELRRVLNGQNGKIDGSYLQSFWFPTDFDGYYDIFISHSHNDLDKALALATWFEDYCGLNCFVDSFVWNSADELLKEIDNEYCLQTNRQLYDYNKRNFSTSHVHAMLSMAILDIIDKTECCIFIESENSLDLSSIRTQTLSPWIYEEVSFMKRVRQRIPNRLTNNRIQVRSFSTGAKIEMLNEAKQLKVAYNIDTSKIQSLLMKHFGMMRNAGQRGLDNLYRATGILINL